MLKQRAPLIVGTLLILGAAAYVTLYRSSPGDLTKAHQAVAGSPLIMDCKKCHAPEGLTPGCLSCHTEIQAQTSHQEGYHGFLQQQGKTECAKCHSEHNGASFSMINKASWEGKELSTFKHPHIEFKLSGAHEKLDCRACHNPKNHPPFTLPKFPDRIRTGTYLKLSQTCSSCHADPHAGGFASRCASCHDQKQWKPAPFFNHDRFFVLRGAHAELKCSQCHASPKKSAAPGSLPKFIFGPVKGKRCLDCHASPHLTRWVESCEACHKGQDPTWAMASQRMTQAQHALTGFRLVPPHQKASCAQCHAAKTAGASYASRYPNPRSSGYRRFEKNCEACHRDEHRGQFTARFPHCNACHSRAGFIPATYTAQDHRTYPLQGAHAAASCQKCHRRDAQTGARQYTGLDKSCGACHRDVHYGQFRTPDGKTRCANCHQSATSWSKLAFDHDKQSRFKLDKAHKNVACKQCHPEVALRTGVRLIQYKPLRMKCNDCHDFER